MFVVGFAPSLTLRRVLWRVQGASGVAVSLVSPDELALAEGIMQHQEDAATAQSTGNPVRKPLIFFGHGFRQ